MSGAALLAFFAGPIGRWIVVAVLVVSSAVAAGWHERNVGWKKRDVAAKQEMADLNKSWISAEQAAIAKARQEAQDQQALHQKELDAIQAQREKDMQDAKAQHDKDVAAARSGALKLRIPASCPSSPSVPDATGSRDSAPATATLPAGLTERLLGLADDADGLVAELNACWQTVASDRKVFSTTKESP